MRLLTALSCGEVSNKINREPRRPLTPRGLHGSATQSVLEAACTWGSAARRWPTDTGPGAERCRGDPLRRSGK